MKKWKRSHRFNKHHIKNKIRGGETTPDNLLKMDTERHNAWHFLFGNMSFCEVARLLLRLQALKNNLKSPPKE